MEARDKKAIRDEFRRVINRSGPRVRARTKPSGTSPDGALSIKRTRQAELSDDDAHMKKVIGYVHRHGAQRPQGEVSDARRRDWLMNWGHDPLKC